MKKVSVIVPAYNAELHIEQCARSVLMQTLKDIEIIFIDDGSTDKTGEILERLTAGCSNAKVIHQENKGLYKTREIGLSLATGEYVGWVDADDYVEVNMFEVLYNTAIENDSELVICDYSWIPGKIKTKGKWFQEYNGYVDVDFLNRNSQVWNKLVKRDLLNSLSIGPLFVSCFDEIYVLVLMRARKPVTINQALYNYRISSGTMSSSYKDIGHYRGFVEASKQLRKTLQPVELYWKDYLDFRVIFYLLMTMIVAANSDNKIAYKSSRDELFSYIPVYYKNQHFWKILKKDFGRIKSRLIGCIIPLNYMMAHIVCKIGFLVESVADK